MAFCLSQFPLRVGLKCHLIFFLNLHSPLAKPIPSLTVTLRHSDRMKNGEKRKKQKHSMRVTCRFCTFPQDGRARAVRTSTVRMCFSSGSREDVAATASSSFSRSLAHVVNAADSLPKRSHHVRIISSWTVLRDHRGNSQF